MMFSGSILDLLDRVGPGYLSRDVHVTIDARSFRPHSCIMFWGMNNDPADTIMWVHVNERDVVIETYDGTKREIDISDEITISIYTRVIQ